MYCCSLIGHYPEAMNIDVPGWSSRSQKVSSVVGLLLSRSMIIPSFMEKGFQMVMQMRCHAGGIQTTSLFTQT